MSQIVASPAKLSDGSWGARIQTRVQVGEEVTIRTAAGKTWTAIVTRVVWAGDGVTLCATRSADRPAVSAPARRERNGCGRCCRTATRTAQIWEECDYCGAEPIYM